MVYRGSRVRRPPVPVVLSVYQHGSLLDGLAMYLSCDTKKFHDNESTHTHTHTHTDRQTDTRLTALFPGLPRSAGTRKVKPIWILLKQERVSGSGISWAICKSAPRSRQIAMQHSTTQFFAGRMPFLPPNQQRQSTEGKNESTHILHNIWTSTHWGKLPSLPPWRRHCL